MVPTVTLRNIKVKPNRRAREVTIRRLAQWHAADEKLKRVCEEQGMAVPIMVC